jgi:hypothetical protein
MPKLLEMAQTSGFTSFHIRRDAMITFIRCLGFNWNNIKQKCLEYRLKCSLCNMKVAKPKKKKATKMIVSKNPRERYQIDTVYLPEHFRVNGFNYLVTIGDHFTRFS